jgi:hypothetical protein
MERKGITHMASSDGDFRSVENITLWSPDWIGNKNRAYTLIGEEIWDRNGEKTLGVAH